MTRSEKAMVWRRHVAEFQASGLSGRAYAKRAGITVSGLHYWRKRVGGGTGVNPQRVLSSPSEGFLPVTWAAPTTAEAAVVEIVLLSGRRLRLEGPVEAPWLSALVRLLETPCS